MFDLPMWLDGMSVVMLADGRIMAMGGKSGVFDYDSSAWMFVPPAP
jgi:hypothetical protein